MKHKTLLALIFPLFFLSCSRQQTHFLNFNIKHATIFPAKNLHLHDSIIASNTRTNLQNGYKISLPATVFAGLLQNGLYDSVFYGTNLKHIDRKPFQSPWWYITQFTADTANHTFLIINGINYKADIWLNGKKIADTSSIKNPYRQFVLDLDNYLLYGVNKLAIKVYPPQPGDFTIGFVDWNPQAPDNETGIFRPLEIKQTGSVGLWQPFVASKLYNNYQTADLSISVRLKNNENHTVRGKLKITIPQIAPISKKITLKPLQDTVIVINATDYPQLKLKNPKLWYPHTIGEPHLYTCKMEFSDKHGISDRLTFKFGIREVREYRTEQGFRGFKINGRKILIKGGGWVDNLFLDNTRENLLAQLEYVRDMNLNTVRLEGFWGNSRDFYDLCDSLGILVMAGWSCHWEWENYLGKPVDEKYGGILTPGDIELMTLAWRDQILWLRNHPSIFAWMGASDKLPHPRFEEKMLEVLARYDTTRIYINSAQEHTSVLTGFSGMKMRGPYEVVPPVYWYQDTALGGAFGFNSETGPGAQVPPYESIIRFIPPAHLWPVDSVWEFHCGGGEFSNLDRYNEALFNRYGQPDNVQDYAYRAQAMNYELMRAMFEAFSAYRYKATGVIQWMLNSAWPAFYWQLYDYYLTPNGAYFGAKDANRPVNAIYDYAKNCIWLTNDRLTPEYDVRVSIELFNNQGKLTAKTVKHIDTLPANTSLKLTDISAPDFEKPQGIYFIRLGIKSRSANFSKTYWLSSKPDIPDYQNSEWYYTPFKQYADFTGLDSLPGTTVRANITNIRKQGNYTVFTVDIQNTGKTLAFLVELKLADKHSGLLITPVIWQDNYFTLIAGEHRQILAKVPRDAVEGKSPYLKIRFWNSKNTGL